MIIQEKHSFPFIEKKVKLLSKEDNSDAFGSQFINRKNKGIQTIQK